jgi:hypothetical protein
MDINKDEILKYLTQQIDMLQRKAVEIQEQHDEVEKQLYAYKQLVRMYRGVYESEAGVGLQNRVPSEILAILEKKLSGDTMPSQTKMKKKTKKRRK